MMTTDLLDFQFFFLALPFAVFIGNIQWAFAERTAPGFLEFALEFNENSQLMFAYCPPSGTFLDLVLVMN
jgi:hypothetical protein